jgi:hypothetical protein
MRTLLALALLVPVAQEKAKSPPKGPPWTTDWRAARWEALRTGKPIFLYFTKTY